MEKSIDNHEILVDKQNVIDKEPFKYLKIDDASVLNTVKGREICSRCYKSRKFFCYTCCISVIDDKYIPQVKVFVSSLFTYFFPYFFSDTQVFFIHSR